jgi:sugar (pentulose or hexulose) kinase
MNENEELVVGVDLGTTDTKVVLTTPDGETAGFARRPTSWTQRSDGRLATTGEALAAGVLATIGDALASVQQRTGRPCRVMGVGIAGLAESGVVLDGHGRETSPVIAWFDERGGAQLNALEPAFLAEFPRRTGLPIGSQWTLPKLLWLREAGLELGAGSRWLNVPEFVAWTLCGEQVSEPSLVSRTGLIDQATGAPWDDALGVLGVTGGFLPDTVHAGRAAGRITHCWAAPELDGAVVTVAGHDHPVAAVGAGAVGPEDLFDSCGTAEVLLRVVPRVLDDEERSTLVGLGIDAGRHVVPGQSVLIGGMRSGLVMRRMLSLLGADDPARRDELDRRWVPTPSGRDSLSIAGAAIHDNDVRIRLRDGATPDVAWAATLTHLAEQTTALLAGITSVVGEHRSAVAAGGWTRMRSVRESKIRTIPRLTFCRVEQPGARGAALFAACAALGEAGIDERGRRFAATAELPIPTAESIAGPALRPNHAHEQVTKEQAS